MKKISAAQAFINGKHTYSKWGRGAGEVSATQRIERGIVVPHTLKDLKIEKNSKVFCIGSCFARNIEFSLIEQGINVLSRNIDIPFDVLGPRKIDALNKYNPGQIYNELSWSLGNVDFDCNSFQKVDNKYQDLNLQAKIPPVEYEVAKNFRDTVKNYFQQIKYSDVVIITLGMTECFYDQKFDTFLNQPPHPKAVKADESRFYFCTLGLDDVLNFLKKSIELINLHGDKKIVISVSPVGLERTFSNYDVIVANSTSKSTLRVAAQAIEDTYSNVFYFPSYEAVLYSDTKLAWKPDLLHVSDYMVNRIINQFIVRHVDKSKEELDIEHDNQLTEIEILKNLLGRYKAILEANNLI